LFATSHPDRSSPVRRGRWILDQLLCEPPGEPPPGVGALPPEQAQDPDDMRAILAQHRADPACAACHDAIDPLGLALENYDGVGAWREADARGELPDGRHIEGAGELQQVLAADPRLAACMARKLFTYGLGRGPTADDDPALGAITAAFARSGYRLSGVIVAIVTSDAFRMRAGAQP
jgi:hypothetical protein